MIIYIYIYIGDLSYNIYYSIPILPKFSKFYNFCFLNVEKERGREKNRTKQKT